MKILYASCRYDPLDRDAGSGVDFNLYESLQSLGHELKIIGPFKDHPTILEKGFRKIHRLFSRKLTAKFSESYLRDCASKVDTAVAEYKPDVIVTHNLIPLVYSYSKTPVIYKTDAVLYNMHEQWPTYSKFEFRHMLRWEEKALRRATLVVTASNWAKEALTDHYRIPASRILVIPIPSSLPLDIIPHEIEEKSLSRENLHLLTVAKDGYLKGTDIAIETIRQLRTKRINASLRVVGQSGKNSDGVEFMGLYKKADPGQLKEYISHYQWAHLLIHPARYEAAGIVCSEAAAFGVPTITNAVGGLATTVEDGISGIVLPRHSLAEEYAEVVVGLLEHPDQYSKLRLSARARFKNELTWFSAAQKILNAFSDLEKKQRVDLNERDFNA